MVFSFIGGFISLWGMGYVGVSVAEALSWYFSILVNKICKIMKIFG